MSQIIGMAKRLQEAEATIVGLQKALQEAIVPKEALDPRPGEHTPVAAERPTAGSRVALPKTTYSLGQGTKPSRESTTEELLSDLSLDASGKVQL